MRTHSMLLDTSEKGERKPYTWSGRLVGCGSNAFNQLHPNRFDLITLSLQQVEIGSQCSDTELYPKLLSCSSNSTVVVCEGTAPPSSLSSTATDEHFADEIYIWGAGKSSFQLSPTSSLSMPCKVIQVSCGPSHVGVISHNHLVYTWGNNESGQLGHGNKAPVRAPKVVKALARLKSILVSCGAYHTGIIARDDTEQSSSSNVNIPTTSGERNLNNETENYVNAFAYSDSSSKQYNSRTNTTTKQTPDGSTRNAVESITNSLYARAGDLYMCGLGKVGQLGLETKIPNSGIVALPTLVTSMQKRDLLVAKVSCGLHHTLMLAVPSGRMSTATHGSGSDHVVPLIPTRLFACGWGDHGRLGIGHEQNTALPTEVKFPSSADSQFRAVDISAGDQHSLASGVTGCYAWGNNSFGQLGVCSPSIKKYAVTPQVVSQFESLSLSSICAGGRHSACITTCGQFYTWGWGEEGQLGQNNEKNSYFPRPCFISKRGDLLLDVALGMSHTLLLLGGRKYVYEPPPPTSPQVEPTHGVETTDSVAVVEPTTLDTPVEGPMVAGAVDVVSFEMQADQEVKEAAATAIALPEHEPDAPSTDNDKELEPEQTVLITAVPEVRFVQGIKELLQQRELRRSKPAELVDEEDQCPPLLPEPEPPTISNLPYAALIQSPVQVEVTGPTAEEVIASLNTEDTAAVNATGTSTSAKRLSVSSGAITSETSSSAKSATFNVHYKEGEVPSENSLVANSARRALIRGSHKGRRKGTGVDVAVAGGGGGEAK